MMNANRFNKGILDMIEMHEYEFFTIKKDISIRCTCVSHETSQANVACPKCLGMGYKITIRKIRGAAQDTKLPPTFRSDKFLVAKNYYIPSKYILDKEDLIVDRDKAFQIFECQEMIGLKGTIPYKKFTTVRKQYDEKIFLKNFYNIINRGKH